ncbi:PEPxxWA-CTERM sorting domain-containing protein [Sphingobium boeckii]|uniref:Ice-binding protein C-terminal domain-containing protein n=1 Tax=Sphingobium boeckii TaxID=1082345 RepID=A0A7W9AEH2_9SPHN|nr:PEPxxWA-CTERM sorting domain-containing protein [Sphingobium boeckii]MBB5684026.1 hypothetical protein [Sphingobium boeckii]
MTIARKAKALLASAILTCGLATGANAATTINLNSTAQGSVSSNVGTFTQDGVTVKITAWTLGLDGKISRSALGQWTGATAGLGVTSTSEDGSLNTHTADNNAGKDFFIFQFSTLVDVTSAQLNTYSVLNKTADSDATVGFGNSGLAYGTLPTLTNQSLSDLTTLINGGALWDSEGGPSSRPLSLDQSLATAGKIGDMLLIGADFDGSDGKLKNITSIDGFKLGSITFNKVTPPIPEPATWAMMITGFGFVGGSMRRRRNADAAAQTA